MFVKRLVAVCTASGLSLAEVSRLCGFQRAYISNVVGDPKAEMGRSRLVALALTLDISLDYLVLEKGDAPTVEHVREAIARAQRDPGAHRRAIRRAVGVTPPRPRAKAPPRPRAKALRPSLPSRTEATS